jgi:hypothetical protein
MGIHIKKFETCTRIVIHCNYTGNLIAGGPVQLMIGTVDDHPVRKKPLPFVLNSQNNKYRCFYRDKLIELMANSLHVH